jgi:hypothetical protein
MKLSYQIYTFFISTLVLFFLQGLLPLELVAQEKLDRKEFYKILSTENLEQINGLISKYEVSSELKGFVAALTMRKAGLVFWVNEKLSLFRKGAQSMDKSIKDAPEELELRVLRLMVQEQCPRILNYYQNLEEDASKIKKGFQTLPKETQTVLKSYVKKSKLLKASDFDK